MAQTESGQNAARRKMANSEMATHNKNTKPAGVAGFNTPKAPKGTANPQAALRKKLIKTNVGI